MSLCPEEEVEILPAFIHEPLHHKAHNRTMKDRRVVEAAEARIVKLTNPSQTQQVFDATIATEDAPVTTAPLPMGDGADIVAVAFTFQPLESVRLPAGKLP